ncbi:hypothetical protein EWM64_g10031 [Hericium alpestre]|uniref:Cytochrome P450 n=1 Tax=Hericium alpestre TaxID=135208 RepID=A0A4Y9ZJE9_9AGAM|nr:hypothetical protein EWM64_g10031 [Hericium alpestre]
MFDPPDALTFTLWTLILSTVVLLYRNSKRCYGFPLPPGPIPFPVIGNVLSAPTRTPWVTYAEWSRKYNSELVSFTVFGQVYIVVNSLRAAKEIFETRSAMYSSRPYMTMVDMIGWYFNLGLLPYGDAWRARRRLLHLRLAAGRAPSYFPLQMQKSAEVVRKLYDDPDEVLSHMRVAVTSLTMEIAYGHEVAPKDDPFVALAEEAVAAVSDAALPGAIVNAFPFQNKDSHPGADAERVAKDASGIIYVGGVGRIVILREKVSMSVLQERIKRHLQLSHLQVALSDADPGRDVQSIAICAGSGGSVLLGTDADVYWTGEMSHHEVLAAVAAGKNVVLCKHFL